MSDFTEYHHAFISASFYELLKNYEQKGLDIFILATRRYAEQRGSRMAQKAISLGLPLTFKTYLELGEWNYSEKFLAGIKGDISKATALSPDYCTSTFICPWHDKYKEMGLVSGSLLYCKHIDKALVRGFNPYLEFSVLQTMHDTDRCMFVMKDAELKDMPVKRKEWVKPFEYHCAHVFFTYSETARSILKAEGIALSAAVLARFSEEYCKDSADALLAYRDTNFNIF
ncbi:MAG: L-2-amino-thiazoline-4-carboxylic acid hydrolase [Treponema sp.]|nr:L-2-amino-thiazoline-4-carboxylic acid hydrolase [Treponema sp.]